MDPRAGQSHRSWARSGAAGGKVPREPSAPPERGREAPFLDFQALNRLMNPREDQSPRELRWDHRGLHLLMADLPTVQEQQPECAIVINASSCACGQFVNTHHSSR